MTNSSQAFLGSRILLVLASMVVVVAGLEAGGGAKAYPRDWQPYRLPRIPIRNDAPASLYPVLEQRFWLEEWVADRWRRHA